MSKATAPLCLYSTAGSLSKVAGAGLCRRSPRRASRSLRCMSQKGLEKGNSRLECRSAIGIVSGRLKKTDRKASEKSNTNPKINDAVVLCDGFQCWARNVEHEWIDLHGNKLKVIKVITVLG